MAFLGFAVPHATARILSEIEVPGEREDISHFHITMVMLGDEVPIEQISKATEVAYAVISKMRPFTVSTKVVSCFDKKGSGKVPIICLVESPELHQLWAEVCAAFDEAGVEYSKKFPIYRPHVTLSFADAPIEDIPIPEVSWGAHELVLWGGDSGDRRVVVHLPFSLKNRVASRYAEIRAISRVAARFRTV